MAHTFYTYTFGCRVNEAEKVVMDKKLIELGFVWREKNPDFYIINSCAVTGKAEREVRQHIYQTRKKFPKTNIIVTGCAATNWKRNKITVAGIDVLVENKDKQNIPTIINDLVCHSCESRNPSSFSGFQLKGRNDITRDKFLASGRLMVKIQDGCDRYCSYCIVPLLRGKPKSRTIKEILSDIQDYTTNNPCHPRSNRGSRINYLDSRFRGNDNSLSHISEIILTAINTECFGKDTGETLIQLIDSILTKTTIPKISFGSIHPWSITDKFLSYYQSILPTNRFIPFFHIPIQSGSNTILQLMNRGYTKEEILKKLQKIKKINPNAFIGTDIIVGFPGETDKKFQETYEFLKTAPIDKIHVFRYSPRPGPAAEKFPNEPTPAEKRERSRELIEMEKQNKNIR